MKRKPFLGRTLLRRITLLSREALLRRMTLRFSLLLFIGRRGRSLEKIKAGCSSEMIVIGEEVRERIERWAFGFLQRRTILMLRYLVLWRPRATLVGVRARLALILVKLVSVVVVRRAI